MTKSSRFSLLVLAAFAVLGLSANGGTPVDRYARWAQQHFNVTPAEFNAQFNRVGPSADPDGDGLSNLAEYALGTDPLSHSSYPGAAMTPLPGWGETSLLTLSTSIRADDPNLVVIPQVSEDGDTWWPSLPFNVSSAPLDNFFAAQISESPVIEGMRAVQYAVRPDSPLKNPQFIRLAIVRFAATAAAPGLPPDSASPVDGSSGRFAANALAPLFATTPTIPGLIFTSQTSAALGAELMSNTITLRGFAGWITVTAPPGVTLIVNGKAVVGSTAKVKAGYTLALKATADNTSTASVTYAVKFGNSNTVNWTVAPKQALPVSVPAGTMAGYTPVNASVGQGGDANISIPITVSPGIAGMEPKLSINYNSSGGNGQLGIGFGLGGQSAISRVGANKAQDGLRGSVKLDANDRFALDGARLISITGADGAAGTIYEKEITDFSRIQSIGTLGSGPQSWKVETKSGLTFEYGAPSGNVDGSRLMLNGSVLVWYVSKVSDLAGNEMRFHYAIDGGTVYLQYIDYTFNTAGGADSKCRVDFTYTNRPDAKTTYQLGQAFTSNQRLVAIEATHDGQVVRHYDLEYQQAELSGVSQLFRLTERGIKPTNAGDAWPSFPPTVFEWDQNSAPNHVYSDTTSNPSLAEINFSRSPPSITFQGDFGGTGRMGIMQIDDHGGTDFYISMGNADGTFTTRRGMSEFTAADQTDHKKNSTYSIVRTGDFNGDGKTDVLHMTRSGAANWVALSNGDGTFDVKRADQIGGLFNLPYSGDYTNQVLAMDLNGDGLTDIVVLYANSDSKVFLSDGNGHFTEKAEDAAFKALHLSDGRAYYNWVLPGDYNGDGLADILIMAYSGTHTLALSNGDGTFTIRSGAALGGIDKQGFAYSYSYISSGDFNGDGLTDVVCFINSGGQATASINYCRGDGTFTPAAFPDSLKGLGFSNSGMPYSQFLSGDFNGDGIADILHAYYSASSLGFLAYGQGDAGFAAVKNGSLSGLNNLSYSDRVFVGDFDGDGRDDVLNIVYGASGNWMVRSTGFDSNRVRKVTNGHLGTAAFEYKPMTDPSVYTKGSSAHYPVINLQTPMYLVANMSVSNGGNGDPDSNQVEPQDTNTVYYDYSDVQVYLDGHGLQQAKMLMETDGATGNVTKTYFGSVDADQKDIPLLSGYPVKTEVFGLHGELLTSTTSAWTRRLRHSMANHLTYQVFASSSVKKDYDITTGAVISVTTTSVPAAPNDYDQNGNLLNSSVITSPSANLADPGAFTDTTVNTWGDQTGTKYMLGRLMTATVTKTAPGGYSDTRTTSFDYDFARTGQLTKEVIEPGNPTPGITHTKTYHIDPFGNIDQSTETAWDGTGKSSVLKSRSKVTTYSADHRFIETTRNDLGHQETTLHEPLLGQVTDQEGPNHIKTHWDFDGFGRPIHELRADGTETRTWHLRATPGTNGAPSRAVYSVTTQSTATPSQTIWYDLVDREIQRDATSFDGRIVSVRKAFNTRNQLVQASEPFFAGAALQYTIMLYDDAGRVTNQKAPGNRITTTTYDGLTTTVQNPKEQGSTNPVLQSSRTVTVAGKLASATDQKGKTVRYEHDGFGLLRKVINPVGNVTKMDYDKRGQRISISEPNTGVSTTAYNGFGQTILSLTSDKRKTTHAYDVLGRETLRVEPEGKTVWTYDFLDSKNPDDGPSRRSVGKLLRVTSPGYQQDVTYDYLGRTSLTTTRIAGGIFNTCTSYDYTGRADTLSYPTGFGIRNIYNQFAHLAEVHDANSDALYWQATGVNARGQIEDENLGNGLHTHRDYEPETGRINAIRTGQGNASLAEIQNLGFHFDLIGNLDSRTDTARSLSESFDYDALNRLTGTHLTGVTTDTPDTTIGYDDLGDLTGRTEVGTLTYGGPGLLPSFAKPAGPHAVTALTGRPGGAPDLRFGYDLRGNRGRVDYLAKGKWVNSQRITYNTSNLPTIIIAGTAESIFAYGPDRGRTRQVQLVSGHVSLDRIYVGSLYEREKRGATYRHVHYIPAGGGMVAIRQTEEGPSAFTERTLYLHKDHLGSIESISGGNGALAEHLNYDAWGRRRTVGLQGTATTVAYTGATTKLPDTTPRGFTSHEMLDAFNLVHMNGRLYDPLTGRFLNADPVVQEIDNLQNLNRYSYVLNNPLSLTDPSGFSFLGGIGKFLRKHWIEAVAVVAGIVTAGAALAAIGAAEGILGGIGAFLGGGLSVGQAVVAGAAFGFGSAFTGTLTAGGSVGDAFRAGLGGAAIGGFTAGAISFASSPEVLNLHNLSPSASDFESELAQKVAVHGVINGVGSAISGDKFAHGFLSGAFSAGASPFIAANVPEGLQSVAAAVVGGTASELGGGKFSNGAVTGAFVYLFNQIGGDNTCKVTVYTDASDVVGHTQLHGSCGLGSTQPNLDFSYGPDQTVDAWNASSPGSTSSYIHDRYTYEQTFTVSTERYSAMLGEATSFSGTSYNLYYRNCTTTALDVLNAGGIHTGIPVINPRGLQNNLRLGLYGQPNP